MNTARFFPPVNLGILPALTFFQVSDRNRAGRAGEAPLSARLAGSSDQNRATGWLRKFEWRIAAAHVEVSAEPS